MTTTDLFKKYREEREAGAVHEDPAGRGFIAYAIRGGECVIEIIFVAKEHRRQRVAEEMADAVTKIAAEAGCTFISGFVSVSPMVQGSNESLKSMLFYGFKLHSLRGDLIWLTKEIDHG